MISLTSNSLQVRLVLEETDMRKSFNGLSGAIRRLHEAEPNPNYLYVFTTLHDKRFRNGESLDPED